MTFRVLVAPCGFKECLGTHEVADSIAGGILQVLPDAEVVRAPLVDGGEGFAKAMVTASGGTLHEVTVTGPVRQPIRAHYGVSGARGLKTAVLEIASAAGLRHVPLEERDPLRTTTYGVGELIRAALEEDPDKLLIGCGDSGTNDAGAGRMQSLGVRLEDRRGREIGWGGEELLRLDRIDTSNLDPRLEGLQIEVACNTRNVTNWFRGCCTCLWSAERCFLTCG